MKKIILFAGTVIAIVSVACYGNNITRKNGDSIKKQAKSARIVDTIRATLDGIPETQARLMFKDFKGTGFSTYKTSQTWYHIDMAMFRAMVAMLNKEKAAEGTITGDGKIDGIRIYFIENPREPQCPTISFVATRDSSLKFPHTSHRETDPSQHRDYYIHDKTNALYTTVNRNVETGHDNDGGGAELFVDTPKVKCAGTQDDVKPGDARQMVKVFVDNKDEAFNSWSVWYRLELFQDVLHMTSNAGVRFYLCRHIANNSDKGRHTFLIVPTNKMTGNSGKYKDDYTCPAVHWNKSSAKDNGELCPHHCN